VVPHSLPTRRLPIWRSRTFVIPEADLPSEFGVSTSYGVFGSPRRAATVLDRAGSQLDGCGDRDLASTVRRITNRTEGRGKRAIRSEEHTSELQSREK